MITQGLSDESEKITVRLAANSEEIREAQRLRFRVFYEEYKAKADARTLETGLDVDDYDEVADHLIVVDERLGSPGQIVGTYRLLRCDVAEKFGRFYTSDEFDINPLTASGAQLLELGRSCVLAPYRTRPILQKLWQGIAWYVAQYRIGLMFGCASLHGTDVELNALPLSYLHHYHMASPELRPKALASRYTKIDLFPKDQINVKEAFNSLPPLIKGYMRLGATIGDGAVIDHQFNTTDVCIVMPTHLVTEKYLRHYQRVTNNTIVIDREFADNMQAVKDPA